MTNSSLERKPVEEERHRMKISPVGARVLGLTSAQAARHILRMVIVGVNTQEAHFALLRHTPSSIIFQFTCRGLRSFDCSLENNTQNTKNNHTSGTLMSCESLIYNY